MKKLVLLTPVLALCGCQSLGSMTPAQQAQLTCVLAADTSAVVAIYAPGKAPKTSATSQVLCDAGTQVGQILSTK